MRACDQCQAELPPGVAACPRCGAPADGAGDARIPRPPLEALGALARAQRGLVAALAGSAFVAALACNLLLLVLSIPNLTALWFGTIAAVVPALGYSLLVVAIDRHEREPVRVLLGAFGWGATMATLVSLVLGALTGGLLADTYGADAGRVLNAGLGAPLIEESAKGVALIGLRLLFHDEFDNLLDGLVYGALIGLGFAMTENILYLGQAYLAGGLAGLGELFVAREVVGGFGHALYTGTTGAALGWARARHGRGWLRLVLPTLGWGLAVFQHFLWNAGALVLAARQPADAPLLRLVLLEAALFIAPALLVLAAVATLATTHESRIIREELAGEVAAGVLTAREYATLAHARTRRRAAWDALRRQGPRRWLARERFFQAAVELAFRKHRRRQGERHDPAHPAPEAVYRARLAAARLRAVEE